MWESFFGFNKTPFLDSPDAKQLFASEAWNQVKARLEFLANHHGVGLLTGEVGAGKSTAARAFTATPNPNLYNPVRALLCRIGFGSAASGGLGAESGTPPWAPGSGPSDRRGGSIFRKEFLHVPTPSVFPAARSAGEPATLEHYRNPYRISFWPMSRMRFLRLRLRASADLIRFF